MPYGQFLAWTVSSKALSAVSLGPLGGCPFRRYSTGSCRMTQVSKGHHSRASRAKKGSREPQTLVIYRECWKEGQAIGEGRKEGISEWTRDLGCSLSPGNKSQATGSLLSHPGGHAKQPPRVRGAPTSTTARHTHTRAPPPTRQGHRVHTGSGSGGLLGSSVQVPSRPALAPWSLLQLPRPHRVLADQ